MLPFQGQQEMHINPHLTGVLSTRSAPEFKRSPAFIKKDNIEKETGKTDFCSRVLKELGTETFSVLLYLAWSSVKFAIIYRKTKDMKYAPIALAYQREMASLSPGKIKCVDLRRRKNNNYFCQGQRKLSVQYNRCPSEGLWGQNGCWEHKQARQSTWCSWVIKRWNWAYHTWKSVQLVILKTCHHWIMFLELVFLKLH